MHAIGQIVPGKVTKLVPFGAFVRVEEGIEGLVHISELSESHVEVPDQVVQVGDDAMVKVIDIDAQGRVRLSRRAAMREQGGGSGGGEPVAVGDQGRRVRQQMGTRLATPRERDDRRIVLDRHAERMGLTRDSRRLERYLHRMTVAHGTVLASTPEAGEPRRLALARRCGCDSDPRQPAAAATSAVKSSR